MLFLTPLSAVANILPKSVKGPSAVCDVAAPMPVMVSSPHFAKA